MHSTERPLILVVDDEPGVRALLYELLTPLGCDVLLATDAASAEQALHTNRMPDLLITDINLPGRNGQTLYKMLQDKVPGLRAIFMSGEPADEDSACAPGTAFINKPFSIRTFVDLVANFLPLQKI